MLWKTLPETVDQAIVIRPPSEAGSIIIQVTSGCSHNRCTFCGVYKGTRFSICSADAVNRQIDIARVHARERNRVFLGAGDALVLPQQALLRIFRTIGERLPWVNRISLYANGRAIRSKSDRELAELKLRGLDRVYLGVESGDDYLLGWIKKGESVDSLARAGRRIVDAGLFLSVTVLSGIWGQERSLGHARATAELLNRIRPNQIAALCLMVLDNTELGSLLQRGDFCPTTPAQSARELKELISALTIDRVQFMANHASNVLPLSGRLLKDKKRFLTTIDAALAEPSRFVPDYLRAL